LQRIANNECRKAKPGRIAKQWVAYLAKNYPTVLNPTDVGEEEMMDFTSCWELDRGRLKVYPSITVRRNKRDGR
jgi:hypothetical protein